MAQQPKSGLGLLIAEVSRPHTIKHQPAMTPLKERSARRKSRYLHNTKQAQDTNNHTLSGIRTCDPNNRAVADLRLRSHGHWNRLYFI
jgi:hypothetical protein